MKEYLPFDPNIAEKYDNRQGSWYTFYPYQAQWDESKDVGPQEQIKAISEFLSTDNTRPLAIYTHFPFCMKQCFFCQCATVISQDLNKHRQTLSDMKHEIELYAKIFEAEGKRPNIREVHFGGGSPSILGEEDFAFFVDALKLIVDFDNLDECSIEIDPRYNVTPEKLDFYADMGINRISFGVQDFNPKVMAAINRVNPPEMIAEFMNSPARKRFKSVNFDILFGLPHQSLDDHRKTIEQVIAFRPDRTNICKLGHRPDVFPHQNAYKTEDIADTATQAQMKVMSTNMMLDAGYVRIGIDHFALPHDEFAHALDKKTLTRNAMGYSPGRCIDILGIGPSAISTLGPWYGQNNYLVSEYHEKLENNLLPVVRSKRCENDDLARRKVIFDLILFGKIEKEEIETQFDIVSFDQYFHESLQLLSPLIEDDILIVTDKELRLTPLGRINPRHVCQVFDAYLHEQGVNYAHSREVGNGLQSFDRKKQLKNLINVESI